MNSCEEILNGIEYKSEFLEEILGENRNYKNFFDNLPEAILIVQENKIVQANELMCRLLGVDSNKVINASIFNYSKGKYKGILKRKIADVIKYKKKCDSFEYECIVPSGKEMFLQAIIGYTDYDKKPAVFILLSDNTEIKKELNRAALFQRNSLQTEFDFGENINIERIYIPAKIISGDFYRICSRDDKHIIGTLIDVRGKGISAALSISAINILFLQEISNNVHPSKIVENLNKALVKYYDETYIAVCVFEIDLEKKTLNAVGAGINKFFHITEGEEIKERIIRGPFLGMFEDSEFEEITINLKSDDKIILFTDGFEFILENEKSISESLKHDNPKKIIKKIERSIENEILENGNLKDDCTVLVINIR
ncbi:MAG: PAS domain S-box protein [Clostridium butyricum]|nr:PAS domain S-box protein [Clostridium butyricum]